MSIDLDRFMDGLDSGLLPFQCYSVSHEGQRVEVEVAHRNVAAATAYFTEHPLTLSDGTPVAIDVVGRAADGFLAEPDGGPADEPTPLPAEELIGLDVHEACRIAVGAGWLVRAYQPDAALTADMRPYRLNLCYGLDGHVMGVDLG